jgi:hypothetical protein
MVLAMPVLLLLLLGTIELGMRVYYRAQVRSAATAAALAAVGTQVHWPIPIPTEFVVVPPIPVPIPVDGIVINTLHLPNVDWLGDVRGEARETRELTNPDIKFDTLVLPWAVAPSPFKWVRITAKISPPLVFSRIFREGQIEASACAIAWIHPDYWEHGWWDKRSQKSLFGIGDQDYRYYRLVPCTITGAGDALEAVITAYVQATSASERPAVHTFQQRMPWPKTEVDSPPPPDEKVDKCTKDRANCKPKPEPHTCRTDGKTTYTVQPEPYQPGQHIPTLDELEAEHCPPPPPPPPDEKKEGSP